MSRFAAISHAFQQFEFEKLLVFDYNANVCCFLLSLVAEYHDQIKASAQLMMSNMKPLLYFRQTTRSFFILVKIHVAIKRANCMKSVVVFFWHFSNILDNSADQREDFRYGARDSRSNF